MGDAQWGAVREEVALPLAGMHVYGSAAALYVAPERGRNGDALVRLEIALKKGRSANTFDWEHKIAVQLTLRELPVFVCVLYGWVPRLDWNNRGKDHVKSIRMEHQKTHLYLTIREAADSAAIQISPPDAFRVSTLCVAQLRQNFPGVDAQEMLTSLRNTVGRMMAG